MTDLTPTDTPRPRSSALWDLMRKPRMIYVLVLTLVVITFIARSQIAPTLGSQSLYLFLMPVVLFAGIIGGLGPGLLATFLCLVFHLYTTGEYVNLTNVDSPLYRVEWTRAVTFVLLGFGTPGPASVFSWFVQWRMTAHEPRWLARLMSSRSWIPFRTPARCAHLTCINCSKVATA